MAFPDFRSIKHTAYQRLEHAPNARRLIIVHAIVPAVISLVLTVFSYLLSQQIEGTGGLGGLGLRSVLESAQSMLQVLSMIFSLFWAYGMHRIALRWSRGEQAQDADLLAGFHHFGAVLRTGLLQAFLYFAMVFVALQISSLIFSMTPLAGPMLELTQQILDDPNFMPTDAALLDAMIPYLPFLLVCLVLMVVPLFYRLRMMEFVLMDMPQHGALHAYRASKLLMRGNCIRLLKVDLKFWWFYLLEILTACLFYGDLALPLFGIDLGLSADTLFFAACILGLTAQTALYIWRKNHIMTAYALVYQALLPQDGNEAREI
jgi:uncharacterized membrane protein